MLEQYFNDHTAPYPSEQKQLLIHLANPEKYDSQGFKRVAALRQQLFDHAVKLLKPPCNPSDLNEIRIGIVHFHRHVIKSFFNNPNHKKGKFIEYTLPTDLVSNCNLGVSFTGVDRLFCIGTSIENKECHKAEKTRLKEADKNGLPDEPSHIC